MIDTKNLTRNWNYPTSIRFGPGRIAEPPALCKELGMQRPRLITDPGLRKLPMVETALASLRHAGLGNAVFSDIRANLGFQAFLDWVLALRKEIGIPHTLADLGVKESDLDMLVPMAVDDPSTGGNPLPVSHAETRALF
jgi:alcohol dehydrogenase class IV